MLLKSYYYKSVGLTHVMLGNKSNRLVPDKTLDIASAIATNSSIVVLVQSKLLKQKINIIQSRLQFT